MQPSLAFNSDVPLVNSALDEETMNIKTRILPILLSAIIFVFPVTGAISAEVYKFSLTSPPDKAADQPKVKAIGDVVINGTIRIPAYQLTVQDGVDESGWSTATPDSLKIRGSLNPEFAGQLAAYFHAYGWILVPRSWKVTSAAFGADGSAVVSFAPPAGQGHLTYISTGACVGCALSVASVFFPEAHRRAKEDGFLFYTGTNVPMNVVRIRPKIMAYRAVVSGQPIDGLAFYDEEADYQFFQVEVSLPAAERSLATPILNWFLPPK
jgi:hypothetical protein